MALVWPVMWTQLAYSVEFDLDRHPEPGFKWEGRRPVILLQVLLLTLRSLWTHSPHIRQFEGFSAPCKVRESELGRPLLLQAWSEQPGFMPDVVKRALGRETQE